MAQKRTGYVEQFAGEVMYRIDILNRDTNLIARKVRRSTVVLVENSAAFFSGLASNSHFAQTFGCASF